MGASRFPVLLRWIGRGLVGGAALVVLASCGGPSPDGDAQAQQEAGPVVLAAASLQESLTEAAGAFAEQGHAYPVLSFAATSAAARQVERREAADLIIAADAEWMDRLERDGLLAARSRTDLVTNRLVVVAPTGWAGPGRDPFAGEGKIAVADPQAVPAGRYARAALQNQGRWDALGPRLIPAENVRAALALVERKQVDRAIVYATDAQASRKVDVVYVFPDGSHPPIRYPAAVLANSDHPEAEAFLEFLESLEGRAIFRRHGFGIAR